MRTSFEYPGAARQILSLGLLAYAYVLGLILRPRFPWRTAAAALSPLLRALSPRPAVTRQLGRLASRTPRRKPAARHSSADAARAALLRRQASPRPVNGQRLGDQPRRGGDSLPLVVPGDPWATAIRTLPTRREHGCPWGTSSFPACKVEMSREGRELEVIWS